MATKHFIYHIFNKKIGCTNNVTYRMRCQNVKEGEYEILEEHTCEFIASEREIELQKQYGYPIDRMPYWKILQWQSKSSTPQARQKAVANTDWDSVVAKSNFKQRFANVDWDKRNSKIDWKKAKAKVDQKERINKLIPLIQKPVEQWSLDGVFIKRWDNAVEAGKSINKLQSAISACCRGKQAYAYGFKWKFEN
jgi:hypothetical protein